jgi:transcriptional antiterminator NusG
MWYVIWVETGKEHKVRTLLERRIPADTYERIVIPEKICRKKIKGEWHDVQTRLFPGYIFVVTEDITAFAGEFAEAFNDVPEFTKLLGTDDEICPVYPDEEAILERLAGKDETVGMSTGIIENDKVRILEGPLVGLEGTVKKINRHKRTAVLQMEFFDRVMHAEVGLEITEKR